MKHTNILEEFFILANQLSKPSGVWRILNKLSIWFSLNMTILIQVFGLQKNILSSKDELILNIGSGDEFPDKCVNTDLFPSFGSIFKIITKKNKIKYDYFLNIFYRDKNLIGKADGIIFSHVLEHIPPHLTSNVLENLYLFLKPGGKLRISVPDLSLYEKDSIPNNQSLSTPILAKNSLVYRWNHKFMYNKELLTKLLDRAGFIKIEETSCGSGHMGNFDVQRRNGETLYILCEKN